MPQHRLNRGKSLTTGSVPDFMAQRAKQSRVSWREKYERLERESRELRAAAIAAQTWIRSVCEGFSVTDKLSDDHPLRMLDKVLPDSAESEER